MTALVAVQSVAQRILVLRGKRVMLDADLAEMYGVATKTLNQVVRRNMERFPADFMFQLDRDKKTEVVTNCDHLAKLKYSRTLPYAFTEHGALMLGNVLKSDRALEVSSTTINIEAVSAMCTKPSFPRRACPREGVGRLCAGMTKQRGTSLIELIMFIVIVSVALAGILLVMNTTTKNSADPLIHKQAIAAAESLLEEVELQDFIDPSGSAACPLPASAVTPTNRASSYHIVSCYNGYPNGATTGIYPVSGVAPIAGLENYNASVAVSGVALGTVLAGSAVLITVTVTDPQTNTIQISGYRTAY